jgi:hypothetical protein
MGLKVAGHQVKVGLHMGGTNGHGYQLPFTTEAEWEDNMLMIYNTSPWGGYTHGWSMVYSIQVNDMINRGI